MGRMREKQRQLRPSAGRAVLRTVLDRFAVTGKCLRLGVAE
jgi:hypothetical protein